MGGVSGATHSLTHSLNHSLVRGELDSGWSEWVSEWVVRGELDSGWCEWRRAQLIVPSGFLTIVSHFFTHRWYRTWSLQIWSLDMRIEDISKYAHKVHPSARRQLSTGQKFDLRSALLMGDPLFRWERSPLQTSQVPTTWWNTDEVMFLSISRKATDPGVECLWQIKCFILTTSKSYQHFIPNRIRH